MRNGRETTAMPALQAALPDDPTELKRLLEEARKRTSELETENEGLKQDFWNHAMNGMAAKALNPATFLAQPDGRILRCSDPTGLCGSEDDLGTSVYSLIFDRLSDPRDFYSSSGEDTGVHRVPRRFGDELRDELDKAMRRDVPMQGRSKRRTIRPIFSRKEFAIMASPTKGPVDVIVSVAFGLDHNGHEWLHVAVVDIDAANCCDLTGLRRGKTLMRSLERDVAECRRLFQAGMPFTPVSVILFDGDGLKSVNDVYGHIAGDQVIQAYARRAAEHFRRPSDLLTRKGGDEFAGKFLGDAKAAYQQGEKVRTSIGCKPVTVRISTEPGDDQRVVLYKTVSVGVATWTPDIATAEALFAEADKMLYASKLAGRNRTTTSTKMRALEKP